MKNNSIPTYNRGYTKFTILFLHSVSQFAPLFQCPPFVVIGYFTDTMGLLIGWKIKSFLLLGKFAINQI